MLIRRYPPRACCCYDDKNEFTCCDNGDSDAKPRNRRFVWGSKGATLAPAARDVCSAIYRQTGKNKFKIKHRKALNTDTWFWINQANNLLMNTPFQFNLILGNIWPWYRKNVSCLQHRSIKVSVLTINAILLFLLFCDIPNVRMLGAFIKPGQRFNLWGQCMCRNPCKLKTQ